jgi:hypothetical protein
MQRHGKHCMQKVHRRYKYMRQRGDWAGRDNGNLQWLLEFVVVIHG